MTIQDNSRIRPSAFHITVPCPGSLQLQEHVPEQPDTEELAEGKAAHHVAAVALERGIDGGFKVGDQFTYEGRTWTVDQDMYDGAALYVEACQHGPGGQIEQSIAIPRIHADCSGTPDYWRFFPNETPWRLRVTDYKYGHRYVDPFENLQAGAGYACGVLTSLGVSSGDDTIVVEIVIVQPRSFHKNGPVQVWTTTPFRLNELVQKTRKSVEQALTANPPTQTGSHCLDCAASHICSTLRAAASHVVDYSGKAEVTDLIIEAAAVELRVLDDAAKRLEARRTGLAAQVEVELLNGKSVPYWKLEPRRAKLDWNADVTVDEVAAMGDLIGVDVRKPPALLTPTQAKNAGVPESVLDHYASRRSAGVSLKPDDSTTARKVFDKTVSIRPNS